MIGTYSTIACGLKNEILGQESLLYVERSPFGFSDATTRIGPCSFRPHPILKRRAQSRSSNLRRRHHPMSRYPPILLLRAALDLQRSNRYRSGKAVDHYWSYETLRQIFRALES